MKYVAAGLVAAGAAFGMVILLALFENAAINPIDWRAFSLPGIGVLNGSLSLIAAAATFWLILMRLRSAAAVRERKALAARARA